jgi:hypothetical protein
MECHEEGPPSRRHSPVTNPIGVPEVWRRSVSECLALIDYLDERIAPLDTELRPFAQADPRAVLLDTIPGVAELLALTSGRDRRDQPLQQTGKARLLRSTRPTRPPVGRRSTVHRSAQQVGLTAARLGGRRGRPAGLARNEPLAPALPRRQPPLAQPQLRQGRSRAQDPDRRLAHALPQPALQARPQIHRGHVCPGKLPLGFARLTAPYGIEKPRQLPPTRCAHKCQERDEHPTVPEHQRRRHQPAEDSTSGPSSERAQQAQPLAVSRAKLQKYAKPCPRLPLARKGSTVRVRQRAESLRVSLCFRCLDWRRPEASASM